MGPVLAERNADLNKLSDISKDFQFQVHRIRDQHLDSKTFVEKAADIGFQMLSASSSNMAPTLARDSSDLASVSNGVQQAVNGTEQIKEETWSTILQGVASTKMVPTKNVLILGTSSCLMPICC